MKELKKAMQNLGFRSGTVVKVTATDFDRALVSVNGETFGIWDFERETFVD